MSKIQPSILVSNHTDWTLAYEEVQCPKQTRLSKAADLVVVTAGWPILFFLGTLMLPYTLVEHFKTRWKQHKIIKVLTNEKSLGRYAGKRIKSCEKQIADIKSHAISLMEQHLKKPNELGLPIPKNKTLRDFFSSSLPKSYWKDFPWKEFSNIDFYARSKVPNIPDKKTLRRLEKDRIRLNYLLHQKEVLSNLEGNERLEAIKKIAEMSFVKHVFKRQESKEGIALSILFLIPTAPFWKDLSLKSIRSTYEGKKHFLPPKTNLQSYEDVVDAHNKLVKNHNFLVPYVEHKII